MMKKLVYISILSLLLLSSCRSKRMITVSLPQPVMQADSTQLGDTIGLPARLSPMFTFDQSDPFVFRHARDVNRPLLGPLLPQLDNRLGTSLDTRAAGRTFVEIDLWKPRFGIYRYGIEVTNRHTIPVSQ